MNTILTVLGLVLALYLVWRIRRRRVLDRRMHKDLDRRFPRRPLTLLVLAILCVGCTGKGSVSSALDPATPSNPSGGGPSGGGPSSSPSAGDPQIIEAVGCENNLPAPAQYQPFSCQLKLPLVAGDTVDVISWTNGTISLSTTTVSDTGLTSYLPVVGPIQRMGSNGDDFIEISAGTVSTSSPSLNVTVGYGSGNTTNTVRDLVLVHTRGGLGAFKSVISSGCVAPVTSTPGPCLPITGPSLVPAVNDLVFVVALSDEHIFNAQTFTSPFSFLWASTDGSNASGVGGDGYFVVGVYSATSTAAIAPALAIDQSALNTNFGWTETVVEASFD